MTPLRLLILLAPPIWISLHLALWRSQRLRPRLFLITAVVIISQAHQIDAIFFRSMAGPDMALWQLLPQLWFYCGMWCLCPALALLDLWFIGRFFHRTWRRPGQERSTPDFQGRRRFLRHGGLSLAYSALAPGFAMSASAFGINQGMAVPLVRRMTLKLPDLPPDLNGLRLAHISDIHLGPLTSIAWTRRLVELTNAARPDLICLTGDLSDGELDFQVRGGGARRDAARELAGFQARLGVFACTGNHEYYSGYENWMAMYQSLGIKMLHNSAEIFTQGQAGLVLAGFDDKRVELLGRRQETCQSLFAGLPGKKDRTLRVVMEHRPTRAPENAQADIDLQLSGHTHGGQCLMLDRLIASYNRGFVRGWYTVGGMALYVTNGAGVWPGYPLRVGVPAEVAVITLIKA